MNTTTFWEWLLAFPFGREIRRLTPAGPYVEYRRRSRIVVYFLIAGALVEVLFAPIEHAPIAARAALLALMAAGIGLWIAASVRYVLAWDELQRRALAESGAITALILIAVLALYAFLEKLFQLPPVTSALWFVLGAAIWFIALPLVRRRYEA